MKIMETIGIIAAMPQERDAVLRLVRERKRTAIGHFRCDRFRVSERDCWLLTSGMGMVRARLAAEALFEAVNPRLLVSVGVAGAVERDLEIGDLVSCYQTCLLEKGGLSLLHPLAELSDPVSQAIADVLDERGARLFFGSAITTQGSQFTEKKYQNVKRPVLEMETIGIVQVAEAHGIPLLSMRAISDGPQAPIPFDLEAMVDEKDNLRMRKLFRTILGHPQMIPQLLRMGRNTKLAAQNAAIALVAALSQPEIIVLP
jgi:adenosylhomocysteine nucleosidase